MGSSGGQSGSTNKPYSHIRLQARAILQGWDVPISERAGVVEALLHVAKNGTRERAKLIAAKALLALPKLALDGAMVEIAQQKWKVEKGGGTDKLADDIEELGADFDKKDSPGDPEMP